MKTSLVPEPQARSILYQPGHHEYEEQKYLSCDTRLYVRLLHVERADVRTVCSHVRLMFSLEPILRSRLTRPWTRELLFGGTWFGSQWQMEEILKPQFYSLMRATKPHIALVLGIYQIGPNRLWIEERGEVPRPYTVPGLGERPVHLAPWDL